MKAARRIATSAAARTEAGLFFAEGVRLCRDLAAQLPPRTLFATESALAQWPEAEEAAGEVLCISQPVAEKLAGTQTTQGMFGLFARPQAVFSELRLDDGVLLCEEMQDPANVGAVVRSAAGLGLGCVMLTPGCADPFGPKALRASMGAVARVPIVTGMGAVHAAGALRARGLTLYAATLRDAKPLRDVAVKRPFALLIGNEGAGLSQAATEAADERVYLPMHGGVESLNAAAAAAVLMYHFGCSAPG